jgi:hypothetical protein
MSWSPRGLRNATQIGFTIISPPWLSLMTPVPPHDVEPLARAAGWQLQPATVYAALRNDTVVLLLEGASPAQMVVARCGDLPLGYR